MSHKRMSKKKKKRNLIKLSIRVKKDIFNLYGKGVLGKLSKSNVAPITLTNKQKLGENIIYI